MFYSLSPKILVFTAVFSFNLFLTAVSYAAHPLITDDTGTQGRGNFQLEVNSEFSWEKETESGITEKETSGEVAAILSYGVADTLDIVIGLPYQWGMSKENNTVVEKSEDIADASLEIKWRFYENSGVSLALKPGMTFPSGDENRGFGTGELGYSLFIIATKEAEPLSFHVNLGYSRNENRAEAREDLWHISLAGEAEVIHGLKVVANIGIETNPDSASDIHPAFALAGLIYAATENIDLDLGIKTGLNRPETDYSVLAGLAWRF